MKFNHINKTSSLRKSFGFTLVELLVVMVIVASLSAISFGIFFKLRDGSKVKETELLLKNISTNMEAVKAETGVPFPISNSATDDLVKYLTGDEDYFSAEGYQYFDNMKPAMPVLLEDGAQSKFVNDQGQLVDSWQREIEYIHNDFQTGGIKNNYENGFDLKSQGLDPDKDTDDIEL